jgi:hypothetical protein
MAIGKKTGGGSRKGVPNKATARREAEVKASGLTPLEFLLSVMRDEANCLRDRTDAAKAAAPYVHPKLAQMTLGGESDQSLVVQIVKFSEKDCIPRRNLASESRDE